MPTVCTKPLTAGEVVFECKPLIHVLKYEFKGEYCDNCLQRSDSLKRCAKCLQMFYCDKNCQTFDWIYHKNECKLNRRKGIDLFGVELPLERLCFRFMLCVKYDKTFATKRHQLIDGSDVCLNDIDIDVKELFKASEHKWLFERFEPFCKGYGFNGKEILHWFGVLTQIYDRFFLIDYSNSKIREEICFCLCIQIAFISHSCLPNAGVVNNGLTLQLRAMKAIGPGEELTISYVDLTKTKAERHRILKKYLIDCKCLKCELNLDSDLDYVMFGAIQRNLMIDPELIGKKGLSTYISYLNGIHGKYLPEKTLSLDNILRLNLNLYNIRPNPVIKGFIDILIKHLKEAIPITHGESHPLATDFDKLLAEY